MPAVDVYYKSGFMDDDAANHIKDVVCQYGSEVLGSDDFPLKPEMFSFKFHEANKYDELSCNVIVRIYLRHPPKDWDLDGVLATKLAGVFAEGIVLLNAPWLIHVGIEFVRITSYWSSIDRTPREEA